jgi:delta 1-pyrroline-5-carboxylate dehydrogenase
LPAISAGSPDLVILIHSLAQAIAALSAAARTGRPVMLVSAPNAGGYAGPGWFGAVIAAARQAVPEARSSAFLDCGDNVGAALGAIRAEVEGVIFTGRLDVAGRLADIAQQHRVRFETNRPAIVLDLVEEFFASKEEVERRCAAFLGERGS